MGKGFVIGLLSAWKVFLLLFVFFILFALFKRYLPILKGKIGEKGVRGHLSKLPQEYKVLHDLMLKTATGTSQIDHAVISPYGIFVIETKNYDGWIYGDDHEQYWTQVIFKKKSRFYNPVRQNYGHIMALRETLKDFSEIEYHSFVAFSRRADLRKVYTTTPVVYYDGLASEIMKRRAVKTLTDEQIYRIQGRLIKSNVEDRTARKEHIKMAQIKKGGR